MTALPNGAEAGAVDPEVVLEQRHLDRSHDALVAMRRRAEELLGETRAEGRPELEYEAALLRRIALLGESRRPLLFGRIDEIEGACWHVGRRHVEEADGKVVVVDWRAPVAVPFYRAAATQPLGLARRRQIMVDGRTVVAVADDLFGGDAADAERTRLRGGDALLAELERARTGEMLDIVATIQAEQDEVIRSPLEGILAVQGGPGTGKTAVALHRAAYLLYNHPELARSGVLVLGPSRAFLAYIAHVLPSLGEESVLQLTVAELAGRHRAEGRDASPVGRVKGDLRMAEVLKRALALTRSPLAEEVSLRARHLVVTLEAEEVNAAVRTLAEAGMPHRSGRTALSTRLVSLVRTKLRRLGRYEAEEAWFAEELTRSEAFRALRDLLWPAVSPAQLVSDVLSRPSLLARASAGLLDDGERALLHRPGSASRRPKWSEDDVALLDEAHVLVEGRTRSYGHVIVDEVQDLTPMQLRMVGRRASAGSMTLLGDLAQATGPFPHEKWDEILAPLQVDPIVVRRDELTLGYRAPGQVLELASRLLAVTAPGVRPTRSVRRGRFEPLVLEVTAEAAAADGLAEAVRLASLGFSVGLIVAGEGEVSSIAALARRDESVGSLGRDAPSRPVTILTAQEAKGLEFDAVVVLEPALIAREERRGLRLVYVALTRPIQHLSIVHSLPLPAPLVHGGRAFTASRDA